MATKWLKNSLTDYDNSTYDTGRVLAFGYFIAAIVFEAVNIWKGRPFDVQSFLTGGGAYLGGLGVYLFGDGKGKEATKDANPRNDS